MINEKLILITDQNEKIEYADISNRNLEGNNEFSTLKISQAIKDVVKDFEIFTDVHLFLKNILNYKDEIIFPMKYGYNAPDSKSILPGICEAACLKYVGADDYAHMICNDKYTAKLFAKEFGLKTAPSILFRKPLDMLSVKKQLNLTATSSDDDGVIVKPETIAIIKDGMRSVTEDRRRNCCFSISKFSN